MICTLTIHRTAGYVLVSPWALPYAGEPGAGPRLPAVTSEGDTEMRKGLTITGIVAAGLLAAGFMAAMPAHAASGNQTAYVFAGTGNQYLKSCNSPGTCNAVTAGTLELEFGRSGT